MRKDIDNKCKTCMSSSKKLKNQLASTENINLPGLTKTGRETHIDFSGGLHNRNITGELYVLIGID